MTFTFAGRVLTSRAFLKQSNPGACGIAAAANYLRLMAPRKRAWHERDISGALDRLPDLGEGVNEVGLATALIRLGFSVTAHYDGTLSSAFARSPCIAALDAWDHWAVVLRIAHEPAADFVGDDPAKVNVGTIRAENIVIDSDSTARRIYDIGDSELDRRWRHMEHGIYYSLTMERAQA